MWAYSVVIMKKIHSCNPVQISSYIGIVFVMVSGLTYPIDESEFSLTEYAYGFLFFGMPIVIGQYLFTAAILISKNTGVTTMMIFTSVIWAYLLSIFRYDESQNVICSVGVVLVVWGVWKTLFSKTEWCKSWIIYSFYNSNNIFRISERKIIDCISEKDKGFYLR